MTRDSRPVHFNIAPAIMAWVCPGLGHIMLGHRKRGGFIMFGMAWLIILGVLIGGIDVVDRKRDKLWFMAQGLCGPVAFGLDMANQRLVGRMTPSNGKGLGRWMEDNAPPGSRTLRTTSLGRANEIGTLYIALAGLMNLVVILDALQIPPHSGPDRTGRRSGDE